MPLVASFVVLHLLASSGLAVGHAVQEVLWNGDVAGSSVVQFKSARRSLAAQAAGDMESDEFVPFLLRLEQAARDPTHLQRAIAEFGGNSSHKVDDMQAALSLMLRSRAGRVGGVSLVQSDDDYANKLAEDAVNSHVAYDHILGGLATGTGGMMAKALLGESIDEHDVIMTALPAMAGLAGLANPTLGLAATFGVALIGGLLDGSSNAPSLTDTLGMWKEDIMKDVKVMLDVAILKYKVSEISSEMNSLLAEMEWVPQMLSSTDAAQAKVAYYLMFQSHLASTKNRILNGDCIEKAITYCGEEKWAGSCGTSDYKEYKIEGGYKWNLRVDPNGKTSTVASWGFQDQTICENWAKSGVPAVLGLEITNLHLNIMEKVWENDVALRPNLEKRMKYQIHEYGKVLNAFHGAMVRHNVEGAAEFGQELLAWMENVMHRAPGRTIFDHSPPHCVTGVGHNGIIGMDYDHACRRRRGSGSGWAISGDGCAMDGNCIHSVNDERGYYRNNQQCTVTITGSVTVSVEKFTTEPGYDILTIGGVQYSGYAKDEMAGTKSGSIVWKSDYSYTLPGWKICKT